MVDELNLALAQALSLCLEGNDAAGIEAFKACVLSGASMGIHAHILQLAGRSASVAALNCLAVARGCDLSLRADLKNFKPTEVVAEYETLFARGLVNALMIDRYAKALVRCNRNESARRLFPQDLIRITRIASPKPGDVEAALLRHEHRFDTVERRQSVRKMREMRSLERLGQAPFEELFARIYDLAQTYLAKWRASDHPLARQVPATGHLSAWGLIARHEGKTTRHIHPCGWVSGIYYPSALPSNTEGGALVIGNWADEGNDLIEYVRIIPEPGLLVLMPSYYVHWVEPLQGSGPRLSIAFDWEPQ